MNNNDNIVSAVSCLLKSDQLSSTIEVMWSLTKRSEDLIRSLSHDCLYLSLSVWLFILMTSFITWWRHLSPDDVIYHLMTSFIIWWRHFSPDDNKNQWRHQCKERSGDGIMMKIDKLYSTAVAVASNWLYNALQPGCVCIYLHKMYIEYMYTNVQCIYRSWVINV